MPTRKHGFNVSVELALKDKNGNISRRRRLLPNHSLLIAMANYLFTHLKDSTISMRDVNGFIFASQGHREDLKCCMGDEGENSGIVVGTSPLPVYAAEYKLIQKTNAFTEQPATITAPFSYSNGYRIQMQRGFFNETIGPIIINEVGIYALVREEGTWHNCCIQRDIIPGGYNVPVGSTGLVTIFWDILP